MELKHRPQNEGYHGFVQSQLLGSTIVQELGIELIGLGPGWIESALTLRPEHDQQDGYVHAGVIATLADHSGGMAAGTLCPADKKLLTFEYKINLLRPGKGERLRCRSEVLKSGKTISVSESTIFALKGREEKMIAKAMVTLALV